MLSPLCSLRSLVTLDLSGIGTISELTPRVRFCGGRDGHTDGDCPIILELNNIAGPLQVPNLVSFDINWCHAFFRGGGKSLVNAYYRTVEGLGVEVLYEAAVTHLELEGDRVTRVDYTHEGAAKSLSPKSVVVASGGFQADTDWLARAWGPAAKNFLIRGTPYNRGVVLAAVNSTGRTAFLR